MDIMFDRLMLMELRENVSKIDSKSFAELRSYNEPPKIVQNIVKAVVAIFHLEQVESGELDDWTNLRNVSYWFLMTYFKSLGRKINFFFSLSKIAAVFNFIKDIERGIAHIFYSLKSSHFCNKNIYLLFYDYEFLAWETKGYKLWGAWNIKFKKQ